MFDRGSKYVGGRFRLDAEGEVSDGTHESPQAEGEKEYPLKRCPYH
jgi:hypothetical protein